MSFKKAFTLIELLVVIAIIGILSGVIVVSMNGATDAARDAVRKTDISTLRKALLNYQILNGSYPIATCTDTSDCAALSSALIPNYLGTIPSDPNSTSSYSYTSTDGTDFTVSATLADTTGYSYTASTGFGTTGGGSGTPYVSTCEDATNAQVQCSKTDISATEEVCSCTYLSGAGETSWTVPTDVTQVRYLVVGGGGGGGSNHAGGGGGAGGYRTDINYGVSGTVSIIVGAGGLGGDALGAGATDGGDSSFSTIIAAGGGRGGGSNAGAAPGYLANNGGSGGGANPWNGNVFGIGNTPSESPSQGSNGGTGDSSYIGTGGGGGGAGANGSNSTSSVGGNGGIGLSNDITGSAIMYAGGGGGGYRCDGGSGGIGGDGGGGSGLTNPTAGTDGLGGGGGGSGYYCATRVAAKGGSGIVIFRYTHP